VDIFCHFAIIRELGRQGADQKTIAKYGGQIMPNAAKVSQVNYTPDMEQVIRDAAPLNLEKAKAIATQIGKTHRSVISKAGQLGVEYIRSAPAAKTSDKPTKAELVKVFANQIGVAHAKIEGLDKTTVAVLQELISATKTVD
jgi:hypothetical protein